MWSLTKHLDITFEEAATLGAYRLTTVIRLMDGNVHVCIENDPRSFPILQRWFDRSTTSSHLCGRGGRRTGSSWISEEKMAGFIKQLTYITISLVNILCLRVFKDFCVFLFTDWLMEASAFFLL